MPSISPSSSPSEEPTESPPAVDLTADYLEGVYEAPICELVGKSCNSGPYLNGKGSNIEPNPPNTIDGCADGVSGSFHSDESIDKITVRSADGNALKQGGLASIEVDIYAYSSANRLDFYHKANVNSDWDYLGSMSAPSKGEHKLVRSGFRLSNDPLQVLRVRIRYNGSINSCNNGRWDEADDLMFAVSSNEGSASIVSMTEESEPNPKADDINSNVCEDTDTEDRCNEVSNVCHWKNDCVARNPNPSLRKRI